MSNYLTAAAREMQRMTRLNEIRASKSLTKTLTNDKPELSRNISSRSVGFITIREEGDAKKTSLVLLWSHHYVQMIANVVDAVHRVANDPAPLVFVCEGATRTLRPDLLSIKRSPTTDAFGWAAHIPFTAIQAEFPACRLHPYFYLMEAALDLANAPVREPREILKGFAAPETCKWLNTAVERIRRGLFNAPGPGHLQVSSNELDPKTQTPLGVHQALYSQRAAVGKSRKSLDLYLDRLFAGGVEFEIHFFTASVAGSDYASASRAQWDGARFAQQLMVFIDHSRRFTYLVKDEIESRRCSSTSGLIWKLEHCRSGGLRLVLVLLAPKNLFTEPESLTLLLESLWSSLDPKHLGQLMSNPLGTDRKPLQRTLELKVADPEAVKQFRTHLRERLIEVDGYVRFDHGRLAMLANASRQSIKTFGKVLIDPM